MALPDAGASTPLPAEVEAYCVKCKAVRKMVEVQLVTTKNGKQAAKGKCPVCGTTMMKFLPSK
jgi:ssDNA-binding Zn-finger/Zn-ribbon topoisomerase 1